MKIKDEFLLTIFGVTNTSNFTISLAYRQVQNISFPAITGNVFVDPAYQLNNSVPILGLSGPGGGPVVGDGIGFLILFIRPPQQLLSTDGGIRGAIVEMARY